MERSIERGVAVEVAAKFLERRGYEVLETGRSCGEGAADIVAMDGGVLVLALVRAGKPSTHETPKDGVSAAERRRLEVAGRAWFEEHRTEGAMRLDVVRVELGDKGDGGRIKHVIGVDDDPFETFVDSVAQGDAEVRARLVGLGRGRAQEYVRALIAADIRSEAA